MNLSVRDAINPNNYKPKQKRAQHSKYSENPYTFVILNHPGD